MIGYFNDLIYFHDNLNKLWKHKIKIRTKEIKDKFKIKFYDNLKKNLKKKLTEIMILFS